jgi:hypothetical protein
MINLPEKRNLKSKNQRRQPDRQILRRPSQKQNRNGKTE